VVGVTTAAGCGKNQGWRWFCSSNVALLPTGTSTPAP